MKPTLKGVIELVNFIDKECGACNKPHDCWLGCKVKLSTRHLKSILEGEK